MGVRFIPETCPDREEEVVNGLWAFFFWIVTMWLFIGIAMASDIFMNAIERICSATKKVQESIEENGVVVKTTKEVPVWNDTVANLTLMALGSSAPEILLSVIETIDDLGEEDAPGELGPGTIVGSAAFNLMIITSVCVVCLKEGHTRKINLYKVFVITSCSSLLAYLWMVVVLEWFSPDEIEIKEALGTLSFYPVLVALSYWADQDFCVTGRKQRASLITTESGGGSEEADIHVVADNENLFDSDGNIRKEALQQLYLKLNEIAILTPDEIATIIASKLAQTKHHSRSWYRMKSSKALFQGRSAVPQLDEKLQEVVDVIAESHHHRRDSKTQENPEANAFVKPTAETYLQKAVVEFQAATLAVAEGIGTFQVTINRNGKEDVGFQVQVDSFDGTALEGEQYEPISEIITFDPYVKEMTFRVHIIDNAEWNADTNFYLRLALVPLFEAKVALGQMRVLEIIIEDDDKPGKLSFTKRGYVFNDTSKVGYVEVERTDGTDGTISITWKVTPGPNCKLISPGLGGVLEFEPGEMKKSIGIPYESKNGPVMGKDEVFDVEIIDPEGGARLGDIPFTTCAISSDEGFKLEITNVLTAAIAKSEEGEEEVPYKQQILSALLPNDGEWREATGFQWTLHVIIFPFKALLCLIPPPHIKGGYPCFLMALFALGIITKFVEDCANNFGRCAGINPMITAVTFVALGTSLPDTFASILAAKNDKTADNAIGNVTGSNCVNVFLGLGLPWTIGSIYNHYWENKQFCVNAGTIAFNVFIFSICGFITMVILTMRRFCSCCGKAELGGPKVAQWISFSLLVFLWVVYIILSWVGYLYRSDVNKIFGDAEDRSNCHIYFDTERYHSKKKPKQN